MATSGSGTRDLNAYRTCQRRLEYLGSRLQDLAVEIGDGQGAVWLKQNMWFLNNEAKYFDDVLFSAGKICNHLITYLTFHKQKLASCFPFLSYMGILYEVGEILGIVRDILCANPKESLSVKKSQIEMFWSDCTPFLFLFENNNYLLLSTQQVSVYMKAMMDLVPTVIQVGLCMYGTPEAQLRGFECFADTCLKLSRALVEQGEFLPLAESQEPIIVRFLQQWILYALELVQSGVKVRTEKAMILSPRLTHMFAKAREEDYDDTVPKSLNMLSLSSASSLPDEVAESSLAPLKTHNSTSIRASCQPFKWISVAKTRLVPCANENRKTCLEEISLKENQRIVSDIFLLSGEEPHSWRGVKMHCPLTKCYDGVIKVKLFIKVRVGERWVARDAQYESLFGKGVFLTFTGCEMEGFVAIEERPMVTRDIGPGGGVLATSYDPQLEASVARGKMSKSGRVKMMVQPADNPRERQYRDACPEVFHHIKSTSPAVEIDGVGGTCQDGNVSIKIPFDVLKDQNTKILVLRYSNDKWEIKDGDDIIRPVGENYYTVMSNNGGTVLASVDNAHFGSGVGSEDGIRQEMEVILGRKHVCKLLIFVEHQTAQQPADVDINQVVFNIVCAEKYRISDVLKEKSKIGLIEIPKSQSADRLLQQADAISLEMKGSVELDPDIPEDTYTLTYIEGSDNFLRFPVKLTDTDGRITFVLRQGKDNTPLHTFFCSVQDILMLIAHGMIPPTPPGGYDNGDDVFYSTDGESNDVGSEHLTELVSQEVLDTKSTKEPEQEKETEVVKDDNKTKLSVPVELRRETTSSEIMQEDPGPQEDAINREASLKILNRNSLVNLAKNLSKEEGHRLGLALGMHPDKVAHINRMYRHSKSLASFYILYEWRGRQTHPELADKLIQALVNIERRDLANIVAEVRNSNHALTPEDFNVLTTRRRTRRS